MPKIIANLEDNINKVALELFSYKGYRDVSMKEIAFEVGIAVGTLYNYFPNKKALFITIFQKSWKKTFLKLYKLQKERKSAKEKIKTFTIILYDDVSERKGLGGELFKENIFKNEKFDTIKDELVKLMISFIKEAQEELELNNFLEMEEILAETILLTVANLSKKLDSKRRQNIKFLRKLIDSL